MEYLSSPWTIALLAAVGAYLLGTPLLIFSTFKQDAEATIDILDPDNKALPQRVNEQFEVVEEQLNGLGFEVVETICLPRQMENVMGILRLYASRREQTAVMAVTLYAKAVDVWDSTMQYVEFCTRLENGKEFNTLNSNELSAFKLPEKTSTVYAPWIKDVEKLYRLHQAILDAKAPHEKRDLRLDSVHHGNAADYVAAGIRHELESATQDRYLKLSPDEDYYAATLYGAYMMVWPQLQPFKAIKLMQRNLRARRVIEEVGALQ